MFRARKDLRAMSYAIVRNEKLTKSQAIGICVHNDRKAKNHSNKEIDISKSNLNYYYKENALSYTKEFDKLREKYNLQGQIRSNSIIMCEMIFTSDKDFFDTIGIEETKRYFEESYNFICNYKNLGEKNIISAVVHFDETTPHMHLIYIPVVHTKDKDGKEIDKVCCRDFWKGRDSYRNLQNAFHEYITSKGFELQRGLPSEETKRKNETIQNYKQITNFENTKKVLENITLELPNTPNIKEFKRAIFNRDEKIESAIIKPRDELIQKLYQENKTLHKELSKQVNTVDFAENFKEDYIKMTEKSVNLRLSNSLLQEELENKEKELELKFENKAYNMEHEYKKEIHKLKQENNHLNKIIDKFKITLKKFIKWICYRFSYSSEDELVRDFEKETYTNFNFEKQNNINQFQENELEDEYEIE
ncbi:MAG: plasmid recombination protein [Clostridia bacterium]|nr:plasmid recombination protein [Clostridia bacterium]